MAGAVTTAEAAAAPGLPAGEATSRLARPIITAMAAAAIRVAVFGKG